jgi:uncharacterized membrane protein
MKKEIRISVMMIAFLLMLYKLIFYKDSIFHRKKETLPQLTVREIIKGVRFFA